MLKIEGLLEKIPRCKSFSFRTYVGCLEVLIMQGLWEQVLGSAESKGVAGAGGAWPIIHDVLYTRGKQLSRGFWREEEGEERISEGMAPVRRNCLSARSGI